MTRRRTGAIGFVLGSLASAMSLACAGLAVLGSNESAGAGGDNGSSALGADDDVSSNESAGAGGDNGSSALEADDDVSNGAATGAAGRGQQPVGGDAAGAPATAGASSETSHLSTGGSSNRDPSPLGGTGGSLDVVQDPAVPFQVLDGGQVVSGPWSGFASVVTDEASTATPTGFASLEAGEPLCISGTLAPDAEYKTLAAIEVTLDQRARSEETLGWQPTGQGITYELENRAGSLLRLSLLGDADSLIGSHYCTVVTSEGGVLAWSDFNTACWDSSGLSYDGSEPIEALLVWVPGDNVDEVPFDFCIRAIAPLADGATLPPGDETVPPDEPTACSEEGYRDLLAGFEVSADAYVTTANTAGYAWVDWDDLGSTLAPADLGAHVAGEPLCAKGTVVPDPSYRGFARIGINLNESAEGQARANWFPAGDGISYDVSNCGGSTLQLTLLSEGGDTDADGRWSVYLENEVGFVPWSDFNTQPWAPGTGHPYELEPIVAWTVLSGGDNLDEQPYDFCVNGLWSGSGGPTPLVDVDALCAALPATSTGTLSDGFEVDAGGYVAAGSTHGWAWSFASPQDGIEGAADAWLLCPNAFSETQEAGEPLCVRGHVAPSEPEPVAGIGINLAQSAEGDSPREPWVPEGSGVRYAISNAAQSTMQLVLANDADDTWCAVLDSATGFIAWDEFTTECESGAGDPFDPTTPIMDWRVVAVGNPEDGLVFDFCVNGISYE